MDNKNKFLASFNNEPNGYAKVISINDNVILGYIGNFGYSVFEMQRDGYFVNVTGFGSLKFAKKEFNERQDQTGMLPLNTKIDMIQNSKIKQFLKERIFALTNEMIYLDKWRSIQAQSILGNLKTKTVTQLENIALHNLKEH